MLSRRPAPIEAEGNLGPCRLGADFFLPHVVGPAAAVDSLAAAQGGQSDDGAVNHVAVVPVVDAGAEKNHGFSVGFGRVFGKLARHADDVGPGHAGDGFLPGGGVGFGILVPLGFEVSGAPLGNHPIRRHQVEDGDDAQFA